MGVPDIVILSLKAYNDPVYTTDKLCVVGVKTTCKDRWWQVLREAPRVQKKHILTFQAGISSKQLAEMHKANVTLVVPESLHCHYPRENAMSILTVEQFCESVKATVR